DCCPVPVVVATAKDRTRASSLIDVSYPRGAAVATATCTAAAAATAGTSGTAGTAVAATATTARTIAYPAIELGV
ncbi:MAG: hypothetical protein ACKPKO_42045, partial [Candidatus Fonsibacter sp.]